VSLGDVILENQEHRLVALKENFVLMRVEVLGGHSVLAHVGRIDNAETVLDQDGLVQGVERVDVRLRLHLLALLLLRTNTLRFSKVFGRLRSDVLLDLQSLTLLLKLQLNELYHGPGTR
jgi:hypothetical protein